MSQEMPIFTKTFDLLTWLLPATNHFPRAHRHTVTSGCVSCHGANLPGQLRFQEYI